MMSKLTGTSAIYLQIQRHFEAEIASGRLQPGSKIDSIRSLAVTFQVNPNTIQKSLQELERDGLIYTDRTNGKFVTDDVVLIKSLNKKLVKELLISFMNEAKKLDISIEEIQEVLNEMWKEQA